MSQSAPTIVIVGGVAGGASAATRARRSNEHARIILFEKDQHVSFANCGLPYYIGGEIQDRGKLLVVKPEQLERRFRIDVRTRHEVTAIDRPRKILSVLNRDTGATFEQAYDKLILSPGASPIVPPIKGVDASNVFTLRNLADTDRVKAVVDAHRGGRAVVVGAGFIGLEMVEMLDRLSMKIALVERSDQVLAPLDPEMAHIVQEELAHHGVELHLGVALAGLDVQDGRATAVLLDDGSRLEADVMIIGIGVRPAVTLAQGAGLELGKSGAIKTNAFMQTSDPDIYAVGDAVEYLHQVADLPMRVPLAGPANRAGRIAGQHAATGSAPAMRAVMGTAIVRVFNTVAAVTGCNLRCVAQLKGTAQSVYVTAGSHAGYYPGAQPMTIKLLFDPRTRKVLGAQIVGGEGVDKRIDVLATTISLGATVDDLTSLDLAYAPPFASAKDPVHLAAFAARNVLDGLVRVTQPGEDLDGVQLVDVRTAGEADALPAPGAIQIPLDDLRDRLGELDPRRDTVVACASGLRGYLAARILQQHGFTNVSNLTGGMNMRRHARPELFGIAAGVGT